MDEQQQQQQYESIFSPEDILRFKSQLSRYYSMLKTLEESDLGKKWNLNIRHKDFGTVINTINTSTSITTIYTTTTTITIVIAIVIVIIIAIIGGTATTDNNQV